MTEPICPGCNGSGIITVHVIVRGDPSCETYYQEKQRCPPCHGSGVATNDEVKEFINYMKEE